MVMNWGEAGVGVIALYVLWDLLKKVIDGFGGSKTKENNQINDLIRIIADKDKNENEKIKELAETVRQLALKLDKLVDVINENTATFVEVLSRDDTNTKYTLELLEKIQNSQSRIHDRIDTQGEKIKAIEIYTQSCLYARRRYEDEYEQKSNRVVEEARRDQI